jgi:hypothetical protein
LPLTAATVLDRFTITGGLADDPDEASPNSIGAGLILNNESITLIDCIFQQNACSLYGGAVYANNSSPTFTNCQFISNAASFGGAVVAGGNGTLSFDGCLFKQNRAGEASALNAFGQIRVKIISSIFTQNRSFGYPPVTLSSNAPSSHLIANSVILETDAPISGVEASLLTSSDSIEIYGSSFILGPTFMATDRPIAEIRGIVTNSIFWGSTYPIDAPGAVNAINTISQGGLPNCTNCPGGNGNVSPGFVNLNDPDGPDDILGTADDGLRLSAFSPGVNAGIRPDVALLLPPIDITGKPRDRQL